MYVIAYRLPCGSTGRVHLHATTATTAEDAKAAAKRSLPPGATLGIPELTTAATLKRQPAPKRHAHGTGLRWSFPALVAEEL